MANAEELERLIIHHNNLYYIEGKPELSDDEYDALVKTYNQLTHKSLGVGSKSNSGSVLPYTMYSLDNVYTYDEFKAWCIKRAITQLALQRKYDGLALCLEYIQGNLKNAYLRGDGFVGHSVINTVQGCSSIPNVLARPEDIVVFGEIHMTFTAFRSLNKLLKEKSVKLYKNPRSATFGVVKNESLNLDLADTLSFIAYDSPSLRNEVLLDTYRQLLSHLDSLGFSVVPTIFTDKFDIADTYFKTLDAERELPTNDYFSDGVVIKSADMHAWKMLGYTNRSPRYAIAWKFNYPSVLGVVSHITHTVGRTGLITPIVILKSPVLVDDIEIDRISVKSPAIITKFNCKPESLVDVTRLGGAIPGIRKCINTNLANTYEPPTACPSCLAPLSMMINSLYCVNTHCREVFLCKAFHFFSQYGIKGIGKASLKKIIPDSVVTVFSIYEYLTKAHSSSDKVTSLTICFEKILEDLKLDPERTIPKLIKSLSLTSLKLSNTLKRAKSVNEMKALSINLLPRDKQELEALFGAYDHAPLI